jgi:hypothetical protein
MPERKVGGGEPLLHEGVPAEQIGTLDEECGFQQRPKEIGSTGLDSIH